MTTPKLIISLTSHPARIDTIHYALETIFAQTMKADRYFLWLAIPQFPGQWDELPETLLSYQSKGLEIRWCNDDIKSHKKYFYAMQEFPDDLIITLDDDLYYDLDMVENLYKSYKKNPHAVSAMRTFVVKFCSDGILAPYREWGWKIRQDEYSDVTNVPSLRIWANSGYGSIYPPYCMHPEMFNLDVIKQTTLFSDEVWLKVMQVLNNTPVVLVDVGVRTNPKWPTVDGTQEVGLKHINIQDGRKDQQLNDVLDVYNRHHGEHDTLLGRIYNDSYVNSAMVNGDTRHIFAVKGCFTKNEDERTSAKMLLKRMKKLKKINRFIDPKIAYKSGVFLLSRYFDGIYGSKALASDKINEGRSKEGRVIAYAAYGNASTELRNGLINSDIRPDVFWDVAATHNDTVDGIPVLVPDFASLTENDSVLMLLKRRSLVNDVVKTLNKTMAKDSVWTYENVIDYLMDYYFNPPIYCPVCCNKAKLLPVGTSLVPRQCSVCNSMERHRALWLCLEHHGGLLNDGNQVKLLHFSPETFAYTRLSALTHIDYYPVDIDPVNKRIRDVVDIQQMQYPADMFDHIICTHVLEHVPDDIQGLRELHRVLKPGGKAYILVHVDYKLETTLEDTANNTPELRKKHYGQHDRLRVYGQDFESKVESIGFSVEAVSPHDTFTHRDCGLSVNRPREIFIAIK